MTKPYHFYSKLSKYAKEVSAVTLNNLALLYVEMRDLKEADKVFAECTEMLEDVLGEKHKMLIPFLENYTSTLEQMKRQQEAAALRRRIKVLHSQ